MMAIYIASFWGVYFAMTIAAWHISNNLTKPFNYWDYYPTKCFKCCNFWALLLGYVSMALILGSWVFFFCGLLITLMKTVSIIYTENERFKVDD